MSLRMWWPAALLVGALLCPVDGVAQTRSVDVTVSNSNGDFVTNLTRDDFLIDEGGETLKIERLAPVDAPWTLLFLLDREFVRGEEEKLAPFLARLRPQDRTLIATFDNDVGIRRNWFNGPTPVGKPIALNYVQHSAGEKDLYGALQWAVQKMKGMNGRKSVIVITDARDGRLVPRWMTGKEGEVLDPLFGLSDSGEHADFMTILDSVRQSGIRFHFLAANRDGLFGTKSVSALYPGGSEATTAYIAQIDRRLEGLAAVSGGNVLREDSFGGDIQRFDSVYDDLGFGVLYTLEYVSKASSSDSGDRNIGIQARDPNLRVRLSGRRIR